MVYYPNDNHDGKFSKHRKGVQMLGNSNTRQMSSRDCLIYIFSIYRYAQSSSVAISNIVSAE